MALLVIEDDLDQLDILAFILQRAGHDVITARDGAEGLHLWRTKDPQLLLLDLHLPGMSGWDVCREGRKLSDTPVIMLTAADRESDIVRGLELGADDYVTKPFSPRELLARVEAVLKRARGGANALRRPPGVVVAGGLRLDPQWRSVQRGAEAIHLTATEFKLLFELVLHEGQVMPYALLAERIWGYGGVGDAELLKGHIRNLRRKLGDGAAAPRYIQTVAGVGYTFPKQAGPADAADAGDG